MRPIAQISNLLKQLARHFPKNPNVGDGQILECPITAQKDRLFIGNTLSGGRRWEMRSPRFPRTQVQRFLCVLSKFFVVKRFNRLRNLKKNVSGTRLKQENTGRLPATISKYVSSPISPKGLKPFGVRWKEFSYCSGPTLRILRVEDLVETFLV
jgi:hypothetical protein